MKTFKQYPLAAAVSAIIGITLPSGAMAQGALEEVIVTAQKREQNLQDVPIAVSAFTTEMLAQSGVKDMFDLSANAPSLIVDQSQTSTTTTFGIRGVFTSSQNFGLESSVGLYVDGVYRARQGSMINNLVDVSSIEVLRGPQGTLFGRNTPAGAVTINSVQPDHEGSGFLQATGGDYDLIGASGAKSFSIIEDELAVRFTGFTMQRDGFVDIVGGQSDAINDRDRWGGRFQALYTPNDDVTVHFIGDRSEVDESCCAVGSWKNNFVAQDLPEDSPPKFGSDTRVVAMGGTVVDQDDFYDYKTSVSFKPKSENTDDGVSLQVDWQTDRFLVTSISAYRNHNSNDNADVDFIDIDALVRRNDANQDQFTQELRISDKGERLGYVAGLYYYEQNLDSTTDTIVGKDAAGLVGIADLPGDPFPAGTGSRNVTEQDHTSYAAFGQVDFNVTDAFIVTAGLRWTREEKDMTNVFTQDASPTPPPPFAPGWGFWIFPPLAPRSDVDEDIDDDQVTGTFKLSWFMNDLTMFYASYGTGYKSGGINTDRISPTFNVLFEAEESKSFEMGMKADFPDQALRVNVALHRTDTDDLQTISFNGSDFALQNAGTAETYGGELDVFWLPTDTTTLTLGYAYNHAQYKDFEKGSCWLGTPWQTGLPDPKENGDGSCDRSGGDVSSNPENVVVFTANQDINLTENIMAFAYGEAIYTDERMTDVNNDPAKRDDDFTVVNLRAGVVFEKYEARVTLWGRNVFDEDSTNTIADGSGQDGRFLGYYKEPATWGVTLRKDF
jgi:outer membrane receptor protein involved in Fe transport